MRGSSTKNSSLATAWYKERQSRCHLARLHDDKFGLSGNAVRGWGRGQWGAEENSYNSWINPVQRSGAALRVGGSAWSKLR